MTQHHLVGRSEHEVLWHRRRDVLQAAAAWTALGGFPAAMAQGRGNVVVRSGDVLVNGTALAPQQTIQTGDSIQTGPGSQVSFVIGNAAFQMRQNSRLAVEDGGGTPGVVRLLRMLSGGVISVWGKGTNRQVATPTLTAGIRGTGVYTEVAPEQNFRSYFCNCYGTVDVAAGGDRLVSQSVYHQSFWGEPEPKDGRRLTPAGAINHTDDELEALAALIHQRTAWQIAGRRGVKNGMGYLDGGTGRQHPAAMPR